MPSRLTTALSATVKRKAVAALLTALIAAGALGGGTAAAATNGAFGQLVKAKVESCKDALATGTHGIGECVSDFAQQHGVQQRQQHSQGQQNSQGQPTNTSHDTHGKSGDPHGNSGQHGGPPTATPGASQGHSKP